MKKILKSLSKFLYFKIFMPVVYSAISIFSSPKENNIVIDNKGETKIDESFLFLIQYLEKKSNYNIYIYVNRKNFIDDIRFLRQVSNSKVIFLSTFHTLIDNIKLKKTQKIINLWHGCGIFKKFGYSSLDTKWGGKDLSLRDKIYRLYKNTSIFTVSSPFCIPYYCKAVNQSEKIVMSLGISRTDCFFDETFIKNSKEHLFSLIPEELHNKKIILYAPTFRGNNLQTAVYPDFLDFEKLREKFSNDYIFIIKHHPMIKNQQIIPDKYSDFIFNLTKMININEILPFTDILISDYSSLIFEYSLFERPMIFFGPDIEKYNSDRGFFINYFDMIPGPLCKTNEELINTIQNKDFIDISKVKEFKQKFMSSCDGNATQRILNKALEK